MQLLRLRMILEMMDMDMFSWTGQRKHTTSEDRSEPFITARTEKKKGVKLATDGSRSSLVAHRQQTAITIVRRQS